MLLDTLSTSLLGNILSGKGINRAEEGIVRADYRNTRGQETRKKDKIMRTKWIFNAPSSFN